MIHRGLPIQIPNSKTRALSTGWATYPDWWKIDQEWMNIYEKTTFAVCWTNERLDKHRRNPVEYYFYDYVTPEIARKRDDTFGIEVDVHQYWMNAP